uniref:Pentatricopeptide repeat-containing protein n=1 Tax=Arundo donax TaxID=35708 RepID=A0A0A9FAM2_ARUDO
MPERNAASWNALLCGFIAQGNLARARELFDWMPVRNNVSWITMISGYAKAGDVHAAADLFERMESKDLYAWNTMIACYVQNGCAREALGLFNRMLKPHVWVLPNEKTLSSVISACSHLGDLRFGLWVESFMGSAGVELDDHVRTALVDLYTKSGQMDRAFDLFRGLRMRDVVSYSAMIVGCGMHGNLAS